MMNNTRRSVRGAWSTTSIAAATVIGVLVIWAVVACMRPSTSTVTVDDEADDASVHLRRQHNKATTRPRPNRDDPRDGTTQSDRTLTSAIVEAVDDRLQPLLDMKSEISNQFKQIQSLLRDLQPATSATSVPSRTPAPQPPTPTPGQYAQAGAVVAGGSGNGVTPYEAGHADCRTSHWSQHGEDFKIFNRFFNNPVKKGGSFIELGALNGISYSNTMFFDKCLGWRGLLIEGHPENCELLFKNRPDQINLCMAVCEPEGMVPFPLHGSAVAGDITEMDAKYMKQHHRPDTKDDAIQVFCAPLHKHFRIMGVTKIDFFSLDVEGAELKVLQTIDFTKFSVHVLIVEADGFNKEKDEAVRQLLRSKGMTQCCHGELLNSDVFVNNNYVE